MTVKLTFEEFRAIGVLKALLAEGARMSVCKKDRVYPIHFAVQCTRGSAALRYEVYIHICIYMYIRCLYMYVYICRLITYCVYIYM